MKAVKRKIGIISVLTLMMVMMAGRAEAFINFDFKRVGSAVLDGLLQELQIKSEFDSAMAMAKEAQERGFGGTAEDLFNKLAGEGIDRFGDAASKLAKDAVASSKKTQQVTSDKIKEEQDRSKEMEEALRAEEAEHEQAVEHAEAVHEEAKKKEPFYRKAYNWLRKKNTKGNDEETSEKTPEGTGQ